MTFESVKNQLISDLETKISESTSKDSIGYLLELRSWLLAGTASGVGGGSSVTEYEEGSNQATPSGNLALGYDGTTVRGLEQLNLANAKPLTVAITDTQGNQLDTFPSSQSGNWTVKVSDGSGNLLPSLTGNPSSGERGLVVRNIPSGTQLINGTVNLQTNLLFTSTGTVNTSGDSTVIDISNVAGYVSGDRIVITGLRIQNENGTANTITYKDGSTVVGRIYTSAAGSGLDRQYSNGRELRLAADADFVLNLSAANAIGYTIEYFLE